VVPLLPHSLSKKYLTMNVCSTSCKMNGSERLWRWHGRIRNDLTRNWMWIWSLFF
jgi:hypothetical protein